MVGYVIRNMRGGAIVKTIVKNQWIAILIIVVDLGREILEKISSSNLA